METCQRINIQVETNNIIFNPIVCSIAGIIGAAIGFLIGFLLIKFCLFQFIKNRISTTIFKKNVKNSNFTNVEHKFQQKKESSFLEETKISITEETNKKSKKKQNSIEECFVETLNNDSLNDTFMKYCKITLYKLQKFSIELWKDRHQSIVQIFNLISSSYLENNDIDEKEKQSLLEQASEAIGSIYDRSVNKMHDIECDHESESSILSKDVFPASNHEMFLIYKKAIEKFEVELLELVGFKDASAIREVLTKSFEKIEENIRMSQEYTLKILMDSFQRDVIVLQAYHSGKLALKELMMKRRRYFQAMIDGLVESDRLSEEESDLSWQQVKEKVEQKYHGVTEDLEKSIKKLSLRCKQKREEVTSMLAITRKKSVERYVAGSPLISASQRINEYFKLVSELNQQELSTAQELTKREVFEVNELQKKARMKLLSSFEDIQEKFCESLFVDQVLSEQEANVVLNELIKKNKKVVYDITTIAEIQTKIIQREVKALRSFRKLDEEEDQTVTRMMIKEQELEDTTKFLASQPYLNDDDRDVILHEVDVAKLLLSNEQNVFHVIKCFQLDVELLALQLHMLTTERQEEKLTSDEEVEQLVKRLEKQRKNFQLERYKKISRPQTMIDSTKLLLCESTAESILNNLLPQIKATQQCQKHLLLVKDKLKTFVTNQNIEEGAIKQIEKGHKDDIIKLQSSLREGFNTEAQILKERLTFQHSVRLQEVRAEVDDRPLSASSLSSVDLLQRLLEEDRNKRRAESLENNLESLIMMQTFMLRLEYEEKLRVALQNLDKKLICGIAKVSGMKRNTLIQCVNEALLLESESDRRKLATEVMRYWKNANSIFLSLGADDYSEETIAYQQLNKAKSKQRPKRLFTKVFNKPAIAS